MHNKNIPFLAAGRSVTFAAMALAIMLAGCGGGGNSAAQPVQLPPQGPAPAPSPPPSPAPTPTPTPTPVDFQPLVDAIEAYDDPSFAVIIGDSSGMLFTYEKGGFRLDQQFLVASASKWLTAATIMKLVDEGLMSLADNPQQYLPYWTDDPADPRSQITLEQLLSFTSGFNATPGVASCVTDGDTTIELCAQEIYGFDIATPPGTAYAYGPHHMQIAAAMAEVAAGSDFNALFRSRLATPLNMSAASTYLFPSNTNPRVSGGASSTGQDYARFLQSLLTGNLLADTDLFLADRTSDVTFLFRPDAAVENGDWHYALGAWLECDSDPFVPACTDERIYSSPGSFGWTPWIDFTHGYYGLIARRGEQATADIGVGIEQILQPLIVDALARN